MVLPTRLRPQKTNANYPAHPAPGQKRFHAALNLLNSHLSQPRCGIVAIWWFIKRIPREYGIVVVRLIPRQCCAAPLVP